MRLRAPFTAEAEHIAVALDGALGGARMLFSTRRGGVSQGPFASLNLGLGTPGSGHLDDPRDVAANRALLADQVGIAWERFALGRQVHGTVVRRFTGEGTVVEAGRSLPAADGQATNLPGVAPTVLVADCLPVGLAAAGAVAMTHAGWRGLAGGVLEEGVRAISELGGSGPISAVIGPGVGGCCYEVGPEVALEFGVGLADGRSHLDLKRIARERLLAAGVAQVYDVGLCTICADPALFFSHRRDRGLTGRQAGVAWL